MWELINRNEGNKFLMTMKMAHVDKPESGPHDLVSPTAKRTDHFQVKRN